MNCTIAEGIGAVDAVVAVTDMLANGAMAALRDAGILPGRDVGVAGFDNSQPAGDEFPL